MFLNVREKKFHKICQKKINLQNQKGFLQKKTYLREMRTTKITQLGPRPVVLNLIAYCHLGNLKNTNLIGLGVEPR